mmetsp:Transcript_33298/g.55046  ORF Transcript_33298/g.55046 Transcript_33298/m.55046 type:complete len:211 (+) Transcript_33298:47-679(+)|eukprot:CAMPEP_0119317802 /NCGR_PEP_ID=MMETSP1333-20130426/44380_1 /TAXON_ID=418940 /ORGANISM="Scyphosphaera apsteinii, Strain RCC1455" /LENGTH=210 /DNA_ID=CAMNT_0007323851 /DNA_START=44 /DNA_END=676 /DNA_ORIENTATION=+
MRYLIILVSPIGPYCAGWENRSALAAKRSLHKDGTSHSQKGGKQIIIANCRFPPIGWRSKIGAHAYYTVTCPQVCATASGFGGRKMGSSYGLKGSMCVQGGTYNITLRQMGRKRMGVPNPNPWRTKMDVNAVIPVPNAGSGTIDAGCIGSVGAGCKSTGGSPGSLCHDLCTLHYAMELTKLNAPRGIHGFTRDWLCGRAATIALGENIGR